VGTVLIVDDNAPFRAVARAVLEGGGHRVVGEAGTGRDGIEAAVLLRPDVVLLDVGLPDLDGFAVCRELTAAVPSAVVVLCSVREYDDVGSRCGAAGFLAKSRLSAEALGEIVAQVERR
jgi:DNA-binding NarL/FixJ family response regulator